jgi:hypothetical protein
VRWFDAGELRKMARHVQCNHKCCRHLVWQLMRLVWVGSEPESKLQSKGFALDD